MPEANGEVINQRTVQVFVPYKYLYFFDEPRMAHVSFEGSNNASYNCDIISHNVNELPTVLVAAFCFDMLSWHLVYATKEYISFKTY